MIQKIHNLHVICMSKKFTKKLCYIISVCVYIYIYIYIYILVINSSNMVSDIRVIVNS
ncbi:MAG: hypothetical protein N7Q72_03325 [Spiroplasma sp. Tabriz.8]|nr:hypothetical protein [Candidatus Phytoplasma australiense]MCZ8632274.1 hypothetical protein [Spiroplasma sp. Tabriz.8]